MPPGAARVRARGFTLIEMIVVLMIISIITTITLVGQSTFDRSMLLTNTAYRVAISIREMQTYGLSSRVALVGSEYKTNVGYGAHFVAGSPGSYVLYADSSRASGIANYCQDIAGTNSALPDYKLGNCTYEAGADVLVESYTFTRGFRISDFCGRAASEVGNPRYCMSTNQLSALSTVFMRPNTDSVLSGQRTTAGSPWIELNSAEIYLSSADGLTVRGVCISKLGQVSVSQGTCP